MTPFDFDRVIDRQGTDCEKYDLRSLRFGRADVVPLWVADMDFAAPPTVIEALAERVQHGIWGYTQASGRLNNALVAWAAARHDWTLDPHDILLTPGVVPVLYAAVQQFTQPGDGVVVMPPVYPPLMNAVTENARDLLLCPLVERPDGYEMDWAGLEAIGSRARLLLFCSPHNPVGRVWRPEELDRLLTLAERFDWLIVSDEIHADLVYEPHRHTVLASRPGGAQRVITCQAPSKTFNIPGLNLSWTVCGTPEQRRRLQAAFGQLHLSMNHPLSLLAAETAYATGGPWLDALLAYLRETQRHILSRLAGTVWRTRPSEGTYLLWLDPRAAGLSEDDWQQRLVHEAGVGLSRGSFFGTAGQGAFRLNYAAPRSLVLPAVDRIAALSVPVAASPPLSLSP